MKKIFAYFFSDFLSYLHLLYGIFNFRLLSYVLSIGAFFLGGQYKLRQVIIALPCVCTAHCSKIVLLIIETSFGTFVIPKEGFYLRMCDSFSFFHKDNKRARTFGPAQSGRAIHFFCQPLPGLCVGGNLSPWSI